MTDAPDRMVFEQLEEMLEADKQLRCLMRFLFTAHGLVQLGRNLVARELEDNWENIDSAELAAAVDVVAMYKGHKPPVPAELLDQVKNLVTPVIAEFVSREVLAKSNGRTHASSNGTDGIEADGVEGS